MNTLYYIKVGNLYVHKDFEVLDYRMTNKPIPFTESLEDGFSRSNEGTAKNLARNFGGTVIIFQQHTKEIEVEQ